MSIVLIEVCRVSDRKGYEGLAEEFCRADAGSTYQSTF